MADRARILVLDFNPTPGAQPAGTAFARIDELRDRFPWFRSAFGQGFWVVTRYPTIRGIGELSGDSSAFSSRAVHVLEPDPIYRLIPEMLDPPEHTSWRKLLRPFFSPIAVNTMRDAIRARCVDLIERIRTRPSCDFVTDFARPYPTSVFLDFLDLPASRRTRFLEWRDAILDTTASDTTAGDTAAAGDARNKAVAEIVGYFTELIEERRRRPGGDLLSAALTFTIEGEPVSDADLLGLCFLLFLAGLDTVTAQLSYAFWHLATHEGDRRRLAGDPEIVVPAVEEFLRVHSVAMPARKVTEDVEFDGCPMRAGEMVLLPICAANRDPAIFPDPGRVALDRQPNPHVAFGTRPHRCLGAYLARLELQVALAEWHARIPDYRLAEGASVIEHGAVVLGLDNLPLTLNS